MTKIEVFRNSYGYFEIRNKPSSSELKDFYEKKYFQASPHQYSTTYSREEVDYFLNREREIEYILNEKVGLKIGEYLDLGCGEGWALRYFKSRDWKVKGFDFSGFGISQHNPELLAHFEQGDLFDLIRKEEHQFDFVSLKNVLEHVLDPVILVKDLRRLLKPGGVMLIMVPNDYSALQMALKEGGYVSSDFWLHYPDHLSYFSKESLRALMLAFGFEPVWESSDYPIDLNLFNEYSNYIRNPQTGKACHRQRVRVENFLASQSLAGKVALSKAYADLGLGRNLLSFFRLA